MTEITKNNHSVFVQVLRPTTAESLSVSGSAALSGAATEKVIRLCGNVDVHYSVIGTATVTSTYLPAFTVEFIDVAIGDTLSAITSSATGSLNITQMV
jgi:hypothetical protein